jgi:hypothetical protein
MFDKFWDFFKPKRLEPDPAQYSIGTPVVQAPDHEELVKPLQSRLASTIPYRDDVFSQTIFNSEGDYPEPMPTRRKDVDKTDEEEAVNPDEVLYHLRRHIKYFYKKVYRQVIAAFLLSILLLTGPPGGVALVLLAGLLVSGAWIYREHYGWQHFSLEVNYYEVIVHVPKNKWLFYKGENGIHVFSRKVTSYLEGGFTLAEQWIFREKCRTITLDTEVLYDEQLHGMTDIKHPELLEEAYNKLARRYGHV